MQRQFFSHSLLANLLKQRYISSGLSYEYLNKLISEKKKPSYVFRKYYLYAHNPFNKVIKFWEKENTNRTPSHA